MPNYLLKYILTDLLVILYCTVLHVPFYLEDKFIMGCEDYYE